MDFVALSVFAFALLVNSGSPGPSIAALVSRVITSGWRDVMPFVAAMWIGEVIWLVAALAGLTSLANSFQAGFIAMKWLGILYLLFLAWKMWHADVSAEHDEIPKRTSALSMFGTGMALTLGNPKIMVFYLALLPTFFNLETSGLSLWLMLAAITLCILAMVDCLWILLANQARSALRSENAKRIANRFGATAMGGAAMVLASR